MQTGLKATLLIVLICMSHIVDCTIACNGPTRPSVAPEKGFVRFKSVSGDLCLEYEIDVSLTTAPNHAKKLLSEGREFFMTTNAADWEVLGAWTSSEKVNKIMNEERTSCEVKLSGNATACAKQYPNVNFSPMETKDFGDKHALARILGAGIGVVVAVPVAAVIAAKLTSAAVTATSTATSTAVATSTAAAKSAAVVLVSAGPVTLVVIGTAVACLTVGSIAGYYLAGKAYPPIDIPVHYVHVEIGQISTGTHITGGAYLRFAIDTPYGRLDGGISGSIST